jgi:integrase
VNGGHVPQGAEFVRAVRELAERAGVDTAPLERTEPRDRKTELLDHFFDMAQRELMSERGASARITSKAAASRKIESSARSSESFRRAGAFAPSFDRPALLRKRSRTPADRNSRKRFFTPAARAVGLEKPRPYDLRHSLASLLFAEGVNPAEIAETMGHSLQTLLDTYTHVIEELRGQERRSAEALIRDARERVAAQWLYGRPVATAQE